MQIRDKLNFIVKLGRLFSRREKRSLAGIMGVVFLMSLFQALGVVSILPFVSLVIDPDAIFRSEVLSGIYNFLNFQSPRSFIISTGVAMLVIIIIGNIVSVLGLWLKIRFVWRVTHSLSTALLKKYLSAPYSFFLDQNTSDLSKNVLVEVRNLTASFLMPVLDIVTELVISMLMFVALILISPVATFTILGIFLCFYAVIYKSGLRRKLKSRGGMRLEENKGRYKAASEALGGIKDIKILGREDYFLNKFAEHSLKLSDLNAWSAITGQMPRYFIEILAFGGVVVFILMLMVSGRNMQQIVPMISVFAFAGYRIMPILNRMFRDFTKLQFNSAVLDKIYSDLIGDGFEKQKRRRDDQLQKLPFEREITFSNLYFSYSGSEGFVLENINLRIEKGTSVALVGPTGVGKTTFVDMILGLLMPSRGEILVDGDRITPENLELWQKNLGYVPQHIYLSDDTIKRNIAFGLPDEIIDVKKLEHAARLANIHEFIETEMPNKYETVVGERGIRLSGGQRQRIGIARALYNDPEVLVLDEATSSLDGITEESVLKALEKVSKQKTLIVIAHRLTTVQKCDMIYLLDKGGIVEKGSYDELMKGSSRFRAMAGQLKNKE